MTARQVWEGMLTELSKANAPSLLLHEFNYYFNKAINLYVNKSYNKYDVNQQSTDDLRVLKATTVLDSPRKSDQYNKTTYGAGRARLFDATYEIFLPNDYLHLLNCICIYTLAKDHECYNAGNEVHVPATRLTADSWSQVINDYYHRPAPWNPYYYIHNVNINTTVPTNPLTDSNPGGTDLAKEYNVSASSFKTYYKDADGTKVYLVSEGYSKTEDGKIDIYIIDGYFCTKTDGTYTQYIKTPIGELSKVIEEVKGENQASNFPRTIQLGSPYNAEVSTVLPKAGERRGNSSKVRCEIRYGNDASVYLLVAVQIDYIKAPQVIRLTKEQVDLTEDTSQIMEFPDYVCQEIINELTTLVMARDGDPRLQVQTQVSQSIAQPAQQLAQPQPQARQLG